MVTRIDRPRLKFVSNRPRSTVATQKALHPLHGNGDLTSRRTAPRSPVVATESGQEQDRDLNCDEKWFKAAFKCHPSGRDFSERSLCWITQGTKRRQRKRVR